MDFTLSYRGSLRANRGPKDKHRLRCHFHLQLKNLWEQIPLSSYREFISIPATPNKPNLIEAHQGFQFAPLVSSRIDFAAAIEILFLRPEPPGSLISQAGDLDNRIKTLLDALKVPHEPGALPPNCSPEPDQHPFFCLLQDDSLITSLSVKTDRLLEPVSSIAEVLLLIRVRTMAVRSLVATAGL